MRIFGEDGWIELDHAYRHDVVVSRALIDDMGGHELCAILKADPSTREVRFVLVASADEVSGVESAAAGTNRPR